MSTEIETSVPFEVRYAHIQSCSQNQGWTMNIGWNVKCLTATCITLLESQAPSSRIQTFLIRNFFFPDPKTSPSTCSVFKSNLLVHTHSMVFGFTLVQYLGFLLNKMSSQHAPCVAILVYCSVRNWTWFCYVIGFENIRIHPSTRYQIRCWFIFSTLECGFKNVQIRCQIRRMSEDRSCIRKEKVADLNISGYV